jgi:hypothetical protein
LTPGQRRRALGCHDRTDLGEVQSGGEVRAEAVHHAHPQRRVVGQLLVGRPDPGDGRQIPGVALVRAVDADEQHVPATLDEHRDVGRGGPGAGLGGCSGLGLGVITGRHAQP